MAALTNSGRILHVTEYFYADGICSTHDLHRLELRMTLARALEAIWSLQA